MCGPLERVQGRFQFVRGPQKLSFKAFSSRRSSLTLSFVESCVDFEVAYLSVLMIWRLPHRIPTLKRGSTVVIDTGVSEREAKVL